MYESKLEYWNSADTELLKIISEMSISDEMLNQKLNELSGGQKSKVLSQNYFIQCLKLFYDEPTNHLDLETQKIIAETFKTFEGTMLVVSLIQNLLII